MLPHDKNLRRLTSEEFEKLTVGQPIWVQNKFETSPWYEAKVTRGPFPDSIAPAIHFRITDLQARAGLRREDMLYYFSDAYFLSYRD